MEGFVVLAIANDHVGVELKKDILQYLDELGYAYKDFGSYDDNRCNYPEYSLLAANAVATGECTKGLLFCGTGVGISLAANKVKDIRCVVCSEPYSALLSRQHNDTNMLALGARVVGLDLAKMIVKVWLEGEFEGGRHGIRVEQITNIERNGTC